MEIQDIKTQLSMTQVLDHYGLEPDRNQRLNCPFHEDKTPSMQIYPKTNTAYCFSSNCTTHGKSLDAIDFIMNKENITKHEAIEKAKQMIGVLPNKPVQELSRIAVLTKMHSYFKNSINYKSGAMHYLKERMLDPTLIEIGYNAGQFHYSNRDNKELMRSLVTVGLLADGKPEGTYQIFAKYSIAFALKNKLNQVVSFYFRSTVSEKDQKHFYLKDRQGLYPQYPHPNTKKLILTEAIIDAATLIQDATITVQYNVLALFGTNGLTEEHQEAIKDLKELEEVIFFFDGDEAGHAAERKYAEVIKGMFTRIKITNVNTPKGEDVNSLVQSHQGEILQHLISERKPIEERKPNELFFSSENLSIENPADSSSIITERLPQGIEHDSARSEGTAKAASPEAKAKSVLNTDNPNNIIYKSDNIEYHSKGGIKPQLDSLKITLQIVNTQEGTDYKTKLDLYEYKQIELVAQSVSEALKINTQQIQKDLMDLSKLLDQYRNNNTTKQAPQRIKIQLNESTMKDCIEFLKQDKLIDKINTLIGRCGVVGEENSRILLFVIASSYKMKETLHGLIQGSSGSGKTRLLKIISNLIPQEDVKRFTRVTDNSFYNYGEYDLVNRFLCFEDIDGLKEEALLALRELMSNDILISSTSQKFDDGNIRSTERTVRGPIASIACTTKGDYYEDNISRSFVVAVDESTEQTQRIINYQNQKYAGNINEREEEKNCIFIQNCMRLIKPFNIINPYANKIQLPLDAHKIRRLNEMYQSIVKQITILNQFQRKQDNQGRLITQKEDLRRACDILFESIILKVDELDGSLRQFFERLKEYAKTKAEKEKVKQSEIDFNRFEIRTATGISKTQQHRYIQQLINLEYLRQLGYANRGFNYRIAYWDNMQLIRTKIKDNLSEQLKSL